MKTTDEIKYLKLLREKFPTRQNAYSEIINLNAILNLPKGTEHFITDLHGAYEAFDHIVQSGSGVIYNKIVEAYGDTMSKEEKQSLAILISYPSQMLKKYHKKLSEQEFNSYIEINLRRMIGVCRLVTTKYTKSKVRKSLPKDYSYIIEELLYETSIDDKSEYYESIIKTMTELKRGSHFIKALAEVISRLTIDHLHIVGDIFDRGMYPDRIIDDLMSYHSVDIQWGNHDILWMGAASGSEVCIANVIRVTSKYNLLNVLTEGYGINLLPLIQFAEKHYDIGYEAFVHSNGEENEILSAKIQKAISIIQFKLEYDVAKRHPEFELDNRLLLDKVKDNQIEINETVYDVNNKYFPTGTSALTNEEQKLINKLKESFMSNEKLNNHTRFLLNSGSIYKKHNGNLLFHGCIPLNADGSFMEFEVDGKMYKGKDLFDKFDEIIRRAYFEDKLLNDYFIYLWQGKASPMFGKTEMKTFERTFIDDTSTWEEPNNPYFDLREREGVLKNIFNEFEIDFKHSKIVNGHIPIQTIRGESPIKANGKILSIDGGLSSPVGRKTGIRGYTLRFNSWGMVLVAHRDFTSVEEIIEKEEDILADVRFEDDAPHRMYIKDTDIGEKLRDQIDGLERLIHAYESGIIREKGN